MNISRWVTNHSNVSEGATFTQKLLCSKGIDIVKAEDFLSPQLSFLTPLEDVVGLKDAGDTLLSWIEDEKKILIFGDYDVDGVTSTAILIRTLERLGANVIHYIPNRFASGYGLSFRTVEDVLTLGVDALITVDTGITSYEEVQYLNEKSIDVIITDHHKLPDMIPPALAVLNPKLSAEDSAYYNLCGAGVAYMLSRYICSDEHVLRENLQLAAIGTIADLVPLQSDNRIIVKSGLCEIRSNPILGIKVLSEISGIVTENISSGDIGFKIAPRINAAGRIDSADVALSLFTAKSLEEAMDTSAKLDELNTRRKALETYIFNEAVEIINNDTTISESPILVVVGDDWHEGVLGIVSSRLTEKFHKPSIVLNRDNGVLKGSGRSISGFSIYDALKVFEYLYIKFGGHDQALGLTMKEENLSELREKLKNYGVENIHKELLVKKNRYDFEIESPDINNKNYDVIKEFTPYGIGNPTPVFRTDNLILGASRLLGNNGDVLKLELLSGTRVLNAIKFKENRITTPRSTSRVDLLYKIEENNFRGVTSLQMQLKDYRVYSKNENAFTHWVFANYAMKLFNTVIMNDNYTMPEKSALNREYIYSSGKQASTSNFNDYLSYIYFLVDSGVSLDEIRSVQSLSKYITVFGDKYSENVSSDFVVPDVKSPFYESLKSELLDELYFDRKYFLKLYTYLRNVKKIDRRKFVYKSKKPLSTLIAIEFFKESSFITVENDVITLCDTVHNKSVFVDTHVYQRTIDFAGKL